MAKHVSIVEYMDREKWPGTPYGLTAVDAYELGHKCADLATDSEREHALMHAAIEAAGAAYAAGFERGQRKAHNDRKRAAERQRTAPERDCLYCPTIRLKDLTAEQGNALQEYLQELGIAYTIIERQRKARA